MTAERDAERDANLLAAIDSELAEINRTVLWLRIRALCEIVTCLAIMGVGVAVILKAVGVLP